MFGEMKMNFDELSDADIKDFKAGNFLVAEEECSFVIVDAKPHTSKPSEKYPNGNRSIKLEIEINDSKGKKAKVFDYLAVGDKLIKFLHYYGFEKEIENRKVDERKLIGVRGKLKNKHRESILTGYKENSINYYINPLAKSRTIEIVNVPRGTSNSTNNFEPDSDIPF